MTVIDAGYRADASTLTLPAQFGRIVTRDGERPEPAWLVQDVISARGLTLLTGASKVGKTTLAQQAVDALTSGIGRNGKWLGRRINGPVRPVLIIATNGQAAQYRAAFADNDDVLIVDVPSPLTRDPWSHYQALARDWGAELVVIDTVQMLRPASAETFSGLSGFACPVFAVCLGYATSPSVKDDEYRALAQSSIWLQQTAKEGRVAHVVSRWSLGLQVPVPDWTAHGSKPVPLPDAHARVPASTDRGPLSADGEPSSDRERVRLTAELAKEYGASRDGGKAFALLSKECPNEMADIWGAEVTRSRVLPAIGRHMRVWMGAYFGRPDDAEDDDEPPF